MKQCVFSKQFIPRATCRALHLSWPARFRLAPALLPVRRHDLPQLLRLSILARSILATVHDKRASAFMADAPPTVKPLFFHRPSITSTYDSAESIATTVFARERERSKCRPITNLSLCKRKLGVKFISSSEEHGERAGKLLRCFQAEGSQVKKHFPTEKNLQRTSLQIL